MENFGVKNTNLSLNYSALREPVSDADIKEFRNSVSTDTKKPFFTEERTLMFAVLVVMLPMFMVSAAAFMNGDAKALLGVFLSVGAIWLTLRYMHKLTKNRDSRRIRLQRLAAANSLVFGHSQPAPNYAGMIFNKGRSRVLEEVLSLPDHTEVGNYTYVTGSGRSQQTHRYGYVKMKLARRLPHMVLDAKNNNFFMLSNLPSTFDRSQVIELEGDFNNHFTLYAPKAYERDALYVFTPDVMASLIDSGRTYDMEVIDDELYIYTVGMLDISSEKQLKELLAAVSKIGNELRSQTDYYADEKVADRTQNMIAPQGARLKSGVSYIVVFALLYVGLQFVGTTIWPEAMTVVDVALGGIFWVFVIAVIVLSVKRQR